jgi:hypothetical protein
VTSRNDRGGRWRVRDGEEARLTPGAAADAEVWSRGFLPLRMRSEGSYALRPAFPGTAVVLGEETYEVLSETELPQDGLVVYRMRAWPAGEVVRDRVVYGPPFVRAAEEERQQARARARARPWRVLLYPLVGLLPEETQVRACDRLGLYSVTATLVSGLAESSLLLLALLLLRRIGEPGKAIVAATLLPVLVLLVLPGLGRAFGAAFLRETGGSAPVAFVFEALRALGAQGRRDRSFVPLSRPAFWERLGRPDSVEASPDGTLLFRGLLPHLTWTPSRRLSAGRDHWTVVAEPPALAQGRLTYSYRLVPLGEDAAPGEPRPSPPPAAAYVTEVLQGVQREWDDFNGAFAWVTCMLSAEVQTRAFAHGGGPAAARRPTLVTATAGGVLGLYLLTFLPGGPEADPLAPFVAVTSAALLFDAVRRVAATRRARYAPSLFRFALPSDSLRPERVAYHAHRDAERNALHVFDRTR